MRSFDMFGKPADDLRKRSACGGIITIVASISSIVLFFSQVYLYLGSESFQHMSLAENFMISELPLSPVITGDEEVDKKKKKPRHSSVVARDRRKDPNNIKLTLHVTFPHMKCGDLQFALDDAAGDDLASIHGLNAISTSQPKPGELAAGGFNATVKEGCTFRGSVYIPRVGGHFSITVSPRAWMYYTTIFGFGDIRLANKNSDRKMFNASHYVHEIYFGPTGSRDNPMLGQKYIFDHDFEENEKHKSLPGFNIPGTEGIGLSSAVVKLVHTKDQLGFGTKETYQMSATHHMVAPRTLALQHSTMLPGLTVSYDFTPFSVYLTKSSESNLFSFISNLVTIVGGVFVTVGLVSNCLVGVTKVGKKFD